MKLRGVNNQIYQIIKMFKNPVKAEFLYREVKLPKSSIDYVLETLVKEGYIKKEGDNSYLIIKN